jgi:uncharacterized ferredoxin-like protein
LFSHFFEPTQKKNKTKKQTKNTQVDLKIESLPRVRIYVFTNGTSCNAMQKEKKKKWIKIGSRVELRIIDVGRALAKANARSKQLTIGGYV